MKKILFLFIVLLLGGCSGSSGFFESLVPDGARQNYEASGATSIHLVDANALMPVTIMPFVNGINVEYPLNQGCVMAWNVQQIDPIDYAFWQAQNIIITYDASLFACGVNFRCRYDGATSAAVLNGNVWDVPVTCEVVP